MIAPDTLKGSTIAIGIPTYNGSAHLHGLAAALKAALHRAEQQQLSIRKLYVSDDSSTDGTIALAQQLLSFHPGLVSTSNTGARGECANTNHLFRLAKSEGIDWMFVLHQDDVPAEDWLADTVRALRLEPPGVVVAAPRADSSLETSDRAIGWTGVRRHFRGIETYRRSTTEWFWKLSGSCIRVDSYLGVGGMDEQLTYAADVDLMAKMILDSGDVLEIGRTLVVKRLHGESQSVLGFRRARTIRAMLSLFDRYSSHDNRRMRVRMLFAIAASALRNAAIHLWRRDVDESGRNVSAMFAALIRVPGALRSS